MLGTIDAKELKVAMRALGFEPKKEEIKKMISGKYYTTASWLSSISTVIFETLISSYLICLYYMLKLCF